jgi:malonate-semialdehyde dehydrogenase (acetylating)/methylmalonate-semialdehyde dehydrogenase
MKRISHWIDGKVYEGTSGRNGKVYNPATGEVQAEVDFADLSEVDKAVATAKAALPAWRATNLSRRAEIMFNLRELVDANRKEIATLLSNEHGKVISDALGEVARGLENIEFACGIPHLLSTCTTSASHSVSLPELRRSTSQRWFRCGCSPRRSPAATRSC